MKLILLATILGSIWTPLKAVDLVLGHFEYQIDYDLNDGWQTSISFDEDDDFFDREGVQRINLDDVRLLAVPETLTSETVPLGTFRAAGEPYWRLSQFNNPGQLFFGFRAIFDQGVFQSKVDGAFNPSPLGNIEAELLSVEGTGPDRDGDFAMWTIGGFGSLEFHFDTSDGITASDLLGTISAGSHSHYNWGFTEPGTYEVRFRNGGRLNPQNGSTDVSSEATLNFVIPHEGMLTGNAGWFLGEGGDTAQPVAIYDAGSQTRFAPDQVALVAESGQFRFNRPSAGSQVLGGVGIANSDQIGFQGTGSVTVELLEHTGPGTAVLAVDNGDDLITLSANGIHRLRLRATQGSTQGEPFVITILNGLSVDYDYAAWADSFERAHGVASGALASALADFDDDGVANGLEFLLFWHGFDPLVGDGSLMPAPKYVDGAAQFEFLRDLHKDDFANSTLELAAAFNSDLNSGWQPWRRQFAEGEANGFYEDGAELGIETSFVMRRRLFVPDAEPNCGFFRFELRQRD